MPAAQPDLQVFLSHRDFVRSLAQSLLHSPADVDDVEQRTWLTAMGGTARQVRDPRRWLAQVVRNHARQLGRTAGRVRRREQAAARPEGAEGGQGVVDRMETSRSLVTAVMGLSEPNRTALLMHYYEEKSVADIARELGVRLSVVKGRIQRGLVDLRRALAREGRAGERDWRQDLAALVAAPLPAKLSLGGAGLAAAGLLLTGLLGAGLWRAGGLDGAAGGGTLAQVGDASSAAARPLGQELSAIPVRVAVASDAPQAQPGPDPGVETQEAPAAQAPGTEPLPNVILERPPVSVHSRDWIARLRTAALAPRVFHAKAFHEIQKQRRVLQWQGQAPNAEAQNAVYPLINDVLLNPAEAELVQGAVFLAIAEQLTQPQFRRVFDLWIARDQQQLELVRAAGIAAALRGAQPERGFEMDLSLLADLQKEIYTGLDVPALYPFVLLQTIQESEAEAIRAWVQSDPMEIMLGSAGEPAAGALDQDAFFEEWSTIELMAALWGTRSRESSDVAQWFMDQVRSGSEDEPSIEHFRLTSAMYVHWTMAGVCKLFRPQVLELRASDQPLDQVVAARLDPEELDPDLADLSLALGLAGLRTRLQSDPEVGQVLGRVLQAAKGSGKVRGKLYRSLHGLAISETSNVLDRGRAAELIYSDASWLNAAQTARALLVGQAPLRLQWGAIDFLAGAARVEPSRRPRVVKIMDHLWSLDLDRALAARAAEFVARYRADD